MFGSANEEAIKLIMNLLCVNYVSLSKKIQFGFKKGADKKINQKALITICHKKQFSRPKKLNEKNNP